MRKLIGLMAALLVVGAFGVGQAVANPSDACGGDPAAVGTDGDTSASVCVEGLGALTVAQKGDDSGYVVIDGDEGNPLTAISDCLDGHIGVQVNEGDPSVVASGDGDYTFPASPADPDPSACAPDLPE